MCQRPNNRGFHYLRVPKTYFEEARGGLAVENDRIRLHLSAQDDDLFVDGRGSGRVAFGSFIQDEEGPPTLRTARSPNLLGSRKYSV